MTEELSKRAGKVIAVEIDSNLIPILEETLFNYSNITIINNDILKTDIEALAKEYNDSKPLKVVANLPYYITSPIIMELLEKKLPIESITVMVQKEVALRMITGPGSKDYGALSLAVLYYTTPEIVCNVSANCFMPKPNVDSSVIRLSVNKIPSVVVKSEELLFKCIRASFNQRRKTLLNGLKNYPKLDLSRDEIVEAIEMSKLRADVRGETLTLEEFGILADNIYHIKESRANNR
nr:16S rRNA (adenine(1518)-N(6)/adenine(1519)-N(6))-dimethyltransferase RsmA [Lachnospiraceae bacterium]